MAGLLRSLTDRFQPTPLSMGLINAGANMMMAGGPSRMPTNLGSTLGAGLQGLLQGYSIENESQADRAYQSEKMRRQEKQDELEYQIKEMQLKNRGMSGGTPGQWYIPPGAKEETFGGMKGYRTPDGAFIPSRAALTEYQGLVTSPEQQAAIARARSAATEGEKIVNVPMGQEGAPAFIKQGDLTNLMPNLVQVESSGNPNAVSKAGARGLTQLMPGTAAMYTDKPLDSLPPDQQIEIGAKYLADLTRQYGGDYKKALEAYNMGPGNIAKGRGNTDYANKVLGVQSFADKEAVKNKAEVEKQKSLMDLKETKPIYDSASDEFVYPPSTENPQGKRTVSPNRMKAFDSMNYTMDRFVGTSEKPGLLYSVPTGGPLGIKGTIAKATEYQKIKEFESEKAQLLGDMKQALRIPGEGVFTDKDAEQLGFQLPDIKNDPDVNRRIIEDLKAKMSLKLGIKPTQQSGDIHSEAERILRGQ